MRDCRPALPTPLPPWENAPRSCPQTPVGTAGAERARTRRQVLRALSRGLARDLHQSWRGSTSRQNLELAPPFSRGSLRLRTGQVTQPLSILKLPRFLTRQGGVTPPPLTSDVKLVNRKTSLTAKLCSEDPKIDKCRYHCKNYHEGRWISHRLWLENSVDRKRLRKVPGHLRFTPLG